MIKIIIKYYRQNEHPPLSSFIVVHRSSQQLQYVFSIHNCRQEPWNEEETTEERRNSSCNLVARG